jgi:signal transduction histidine kinase
MTGSRSPGGAASGQVGRSATTPGGLQTPLWRAIAVYRLVAFGYVTVLVVNYVTDYQRPTLAWPVLAAMAAWTAVTAYGYADPARRRWPLLAADLLVTVGVLLASLVVVGRAGLETGLPTLGVAWHVAPVLAWAVSGGRRRGILAAVVVAGTDLAVRGHFVQSAFTGAALLLMAAFAVGYLVRRADDAERRLQQAIELEAANRERDRLARNIHDSVLQVLALVKRRGADLDGAAGELARLAGEQEAALRALVTTHPPTAVAGAAHADLLSLLRPYASNDVSIAGPAGPVPLPAEMAAEVGAAVAAALDNVVRHCPPGTRAWVLVEDEPDWVTVSIRDDGRGMTGEREQQAVHEGRLGIAQSIRGRIRELGGTVHIGSAPDRGTEVEIVVPHQRLS